VPEPPLLVAPSPPTDKRRPLATAVAPVAGAATKQGRSGAARVVAYLPSGTAAAAGPVSSGVTDTAVAFKRLQNGSDIRGVALSSALCVGGS
jgi:hypothetical protein